MVSDSFVTATEVHSLSPQLGFTRVGSSHIVEVGYIRLRWERVGVRGYGLS
jgi:hypothetical protein